MKNSLKGYMLSNEELLLLKGGGNGPTTVVCYNANNESFDCKTFDTCDNEAMGNYCKSVGAARAGYSCGVTNTCSHID